MLYANKFSTEVGHLCIVLGRVRVNMGAQQKEKGRSTLFKQFHWAKCCIHPGRANMTGHAGCRTQAKVTVHGVPPANGRALVAFIQCWPTRQVMQVTAPE